MDSEQKQHSYGVEFIRCSRCLVLRNPARLDKGICLDTVFCDTISRLNELAKESVAKT